MYDHVCKITNQNMQENKIKIPSTVFLLHQKYHVELPTATLQIIIIFLCSVEYKFNDRYYFLVLHKKVLFLAFTFTVFSIHFFLHKTRVKMIQIDCEIFYMRSSIVSTLLVQLLK